MARSRFEAASEEAGRLRSELAGLLEGREGLAELRQELTRSRGLVDAVIEVDSRGRRCPLPIIDLARRMPSVPVGAVVRVLADDPAQIARLQTLRQQTKAEAQRLLASFGAKLENAEPMDPEDTRVDPATAPTEATTIPWSELTTSARNRSFVASTTARNASFANTP